PGRRKKPEIFTGLVLDSGKCRKISTTTVHVREFGNINNRRIWMRRGSQFRGEDQLWNADRLVDKNLLLIFRAIAPLQNGFNRDHRRLKFERALQEQCRLQWRRRVLAPNVDDRYRQRFRLRLRIPNEPTEKNLFRALKARFTQKQKAEQQHNNDDPDRRPFHRTKVKSDE